MLRERIFLIPALGTVTLVFYIFIILFVLNIQTASYIYLFCLCFINMPGAMLMIYLTFLYPSMNPNHKILSIIFWYLMFLPIACELECIIPKDRPPIKLRTIRVSINLDTCPICHDNKVNCSTRCKHSFCRDCILKWHETQKESEPRRKSKCPLCIAPL